MDSNIAGNRGKLDMSDPSAPASGATSMPSLPAPQASGATNAQNTTFPSPNTNDPTYLARTVVLNNYDNPWQMAEQLWLLKKQYLESTYNIHFQ